MSMEHRTPWKLDKTGYLWFIQWILSRVGSSWHDIKPLPRNPRFFWASAFSRCLGIIKVNKSWEIFCELPLCEKKTGIKLDKEDMKKADLNKTKTPISEISKGNNDNICGTWRKWRKKCAHFDKFRREWCFSFHWTKHAFMFVLNFFYTHFSSIIEKKATIGIVVRKRYNWNSLGLWTFNGLLKIKSFTTYQLHFAAATNE